MPKQPRGALSVPSARTPDITDLYELKFKRSDHFGAAYEMNSIDEREILKCIRQGRANADFLIATIHAHEPGNWSDQPADFVQKLAHEAIDNGADAFIVHGPHQLRGIEIYKGKPMFYSLGNFIFHLNLEEPAVWDLYEQLQLDPNSMLDAELNENRRKQNFGDDLFYQSVIAVSKFENGVVSEIRLYPVDLGAHGSPTVRGIPKIANGALARSILERLDRLSRPFGVTITMEHDQGLIRPMR